MSALGIPSPAGLAGTLTSMLPDAAHALALGQWQVAATVTAAVRALEPRDELADVPEPRSITEVIADMRACGYVAQPAVELDTFPSRRRAWWLRSRTAKRGTKRLLGDCQAFAVLASSRLAQLRSVGPIRILSLRGLRADGSLLGHAETVYSAGGRWWSMGQSGRHGPWGSSKEAARGIMERWAGARLLWWAELHCADLSLLAHHREEG